ncbi:MAG: SMC family ATPase [Anaerolineae bacterium]|nr:SMC family ATPase [Anaerolineae bacterium]MBT7075270.1 SMC family ATPase [Anaerolineae bacterium]MBT7783214.1 SMC family ATPase [Anaerolineae bacterium]
MHPKRQQDAHFTSSIIPTMIPITLKISGFLSYRDPVELNFEEFDLACISGNNGAGKSSLLDAITWSLFGQARKRDDSLVNLQSKAAEVIYDFRYENNTYRIQRTMPRGKKKNLEFQIYDNGLWRPLTEATIRATQERIEQTLRLDYDTFVNAAFFLQGKADQFTQQTASKRKETLGNILGLEIWDVYKTRAGEKRREVEKGLDVVEGRIAEIDEELDEEPTRKERLAQLENELEILLDSRKKQEAHFEQIRRLTASLAEQRKLANLLSDTLSRSKKTRTDLDTRRDERIEKRDIYAKLINRAKDIDEKYNAWKASRTALAHWEEISAQFHEQEAKRQPFLQAINEEKVRLAHDLKALENQEAGIKNQEIEIGKLEEEMALRKTELEEIEQKITERDAFQKEQAEAREKYAELRVENKQYKKEMEDLEKRIKEFAAIESADCPLCGQELSEEHHAETLTQMKKEGKAKGDQYRANTAEMKAIYEDVQNYAIRNTEYDNIEKERLDISKKMTQLEAKFTALSKSVEGWEKEGEKEYLKVKTTLEKENFSIEARENLTEIDDELKKLGYAAKSHDEVRQEEKKLREVEEEYNSLENARAALKPLEEEVQNLDEQIAKSEKEIDEQKAKYDEVEKTLTDAETQAPDEGTAYADLLKMQEKENQARDEVGAARQNVEVLSGLKIRKSEYKSEREVHALEISRYKKLERAFGKNGVPALLIEQALPEIEEKANALLDRLSNGQMSIRFVTQSEYKDAKRDDMKETLDIQISDSAGVRDYEMYSGGEAFRVNFAIRIALSQTLSGRKGARLQTLIIDEGFGSQDALGRQRLIEAINQVRGDFAKILVITHLESLRDAFPSQILVEKGERGSEVRVI